MITIRDVLENYLLYLYRTLKQKVQEHPAQVKQKNELISISGVHGRCD